MGRGSSNSASHLPSLLKSFVELNISSAVEVDYFTDYSCSEYGCDDEGICRCGEIVETSIDRVSLVDLAREIAPEEFAPEDLYTIERAIRSKEIWERSFAWDVSTTGGYYGEEIEGVEMDRSSAQELDQVVSEIMEKPLAVRLAFLLGEEKKENVDPEDIAKRAWAYERVPVEMVDGIEHLPSPDKAFWGYDSSRFPIGVALETPDGRYKLVDGRVRVSTFLNWKNAKKKKKELPLLIGRL
jgi:hypothetical protein